jgi:hypothetical protein
MILVGGKVTKKNKNTFHKQHNSVDGLGVDVNK